MIEIKDIMPIGFLKKSRFTGSYLGMRFLLRKSANEDAPEQLEAIAWPEPFCFEASDENTHIAASFPFSTEGISQAVDWLNSVYQDRFSTRSAF